jgi:hypothetical protein
MLSVRQTNVVKPFFDLAQLDLTATPCSFTYAQSEGLGLKVTSPWLTGIGVVHNC